MSTRKLILAALVCGLVILLAGGIQLVVLSGDDGGDASRALLAAGEVAEVSGVTASVESVAGEDGRLVVAVTMAVDDGGEALDDAEEGWALFVTGASEPAPRVAPEERPCRGVAVPPGATVHCQVAFDVSGDAGDEAGPVVLFGRGSERASWQPGVRYDASRAARPEP